MINGVTNKINRVFPPSGGGKAPPPYVDIVARISSNDVVELPGGMSHTTNILVTYTKPQRVYIPQVVRVSVDPAMKDLLMQPFYGTNASGVQTMLYAGCSQSEADDFFDVEYPKLLQAKFPAETNIKFIGGQVNTPGTHTLYVLNEFNHTNSAILGVAHGSSLCNLIQPNTSSIYGKAFPNGLREEYQRYVNGIVAPSHANLWDVLPSPKIVPLWMLKNAFVGVGAHEVGHMLGLVAPELGGTSGWHYTSPIPLPAFLMNDGENTPWVYRVEPSVERAFRTSDKDYLNWLLP